MEWSHYQLVHGKMETAEGVVENENYATELQKLRDEHGAGNSRILRFKNDAPAPKEGESFAMHKF